MCVLSISIVSYHNFADVEKLVGSIEQFTPPEITKKIYIVDNADEEAAYRELASRYPDVSYRHTGKNLGYGKGHNTVLPELESVYHALVNPDVWLIGDAFGALLHFLEAHPDIGMVIPRIVGEDGVRQPVYRREVTFLDMAIRMFLPERMFKKRRAYHTMQEMDDTKPFPVPFGQGSFLVARTPLLQKLGGFDERFFLYMEDADLCRRCNRISSLFYCPDATVVHRWEKGSHKNVRLLLLHVASMLRYFWKWRGGGN